MLPERQVLRPPLPSCDLSHHQRSERIGRGRGPRALVAPVIARRMRGDHVSAGILSPVLPGDQVLCRASEGRSSASSKAQLVWGGLPHGQAAVVTAARLGKKGEGAKGFEALVAHQGLRNRKDSRASSGEPRAPGPSGGRAQHRRFCDRHRLYSVERECAQPVIVRTLTRRRRVKFWRGPRGRHHSHLQAIGWLGRGADRESVGCQHRENSTPCAFRFLK
jgi:hypothetical protein